MIGLRGMHRELRPYAEYAHEIANYYGIKPRVTSVERSWASQVRLRRNYERCVSQGRFPSPPNCLFPANRPGDSAHQYGLAWDSTVDAHDQALWDEIRRYVGFHVPSHDQIHGELPQWRSYVR